ncbi:hypothetical protein F5Y10DRAFT_287415 [Nemania abortiva]|nr:hypothetical protein F5Y10DRAFT_287415 [Nemania abortiva]
MDRRPTVTLPYDILYLLAQEVPLGDLLNLALMRKDLWEPFYRIAFKRALTETPFDRDLPPLTHAIKKGDIQLLSRCIDFLDSRHPNGWNWSQFYVEGVGRILVLAATYNLESLRYLVGKYPLWPGSSEDQPPQSVLDHGLYSYRNARYTASLVHIKNRQLVIGALKRERYDCASFLLRHQPPLFAGGFPLSGTPTCYSSATTLRFLIDHNAFLGVNPLHIAASLADLPDDQVFDVLVERGFGVDSPSHSYEHSSLREAMTPLNAACGSLQPTKVEALLRLGANPNGVARSIWIKKVPFTTELQHYSPNPILTLLFSNRWDLVAPSDYDHMSHGFTQCLQSLLRRGARTSIRLGNGSVLEVLVLRMWKVLCKQIMRRNPELPQAPDQPFDKNQGVQSLLLALSSISLSPWDEVYRMVSAVDSTRGANTGQGSAQLVQLFRDYQEKYGDLPGPAQLRGSVLLILPDRFGAQ